MIGLGLDLSLTGPGLVLLDSKNLSEPIMAVELAVPKDGHVFDRVHNLGGQVDEIIEQHEIGAACIEGYGQGSHRNVSAFIKQVYVGYEVRVILRDLHSIEWWECPPQSLKGFVVGKKKVPSGARGKKEIISAVQRLWGFETRNHNIADAYAAAVFGLAKEGAVPIRDWQVDYLDRVSGQKVG